MQHMATDLGFFSLVWGILVLAFSTAKLGAGLRHGASYEIGVSSLHAAQEIESETQGKGSCLNASSIQAADAEPGEPWKNWAMWWFIRTYLQSLGQVSTDLGHLVTHRIDV